MKVDLNISLFLPGILRANMQQNQRTTKSEPLRVQEREEKYQNKKKGELGPVAIQALFFFKVLFIYF